MFREVLTESKSKKLLGDLQVAWNKYKFNIDVNPSQAETFQKKAYKLWKQVEKIDVDARNSAGKLWKDIIDADISVGGRSPKIVKITEAKSEYVIWGVPKGEKDEQILFTKAKSDGEAKKVMKILQDKHGVTKARVQVLDFDGDLGFNKAVGA